MNYTDEEVDLITEAHAKRKRFLEAKANRDKDPDEYADAKADLSEHRAFWRGIREMSAVETDDDDAAPAPATVKAGAAVVTDSESED